MTAAAAAETGLAVGTPVICGTTDAGAEAVSVGVVEEGDAMLMYGSTTFFARLSREARPGTGVWMGIMCWTACTPIPAAWPPPAR